MAFTETAWNRARVRLGELEALRDALEQELEALDERGEPAASVAESNAVISAA